MYLPPSVTVSTSFSDVAATSFATDCLPGMLRKYCE